MCILISIDSIGLFEIIKITIKINSNVKNNYYNSHNVLQKIIAIIVLELGTIDI